MINSPILINSFRYFMVATLRQYGSRELNNILKIATLVLWLFSFSSFGQNKDFVTVKKSMTLMGSRFDITVVSVDEELGYINIQEAVGEIKRI